MKKKWKRTAALKFHGGSILTATWPDELRPNDAEIESLKAWLASVAQDLCGENHDVFSRLTEDGGMTGHPF